MVIPASDIVTVNAGGRLFMTTINTLVSSGARFFQALLGQTGSALADQVSAVTPVGTKRARLEEGGANDTGTGSPASIFVDRDPDIFADVLYFMRCNCISPKMEDDPVRLKMLHTEAEFFIYDALSNACSKQLEDLKFKAMAEKALKNGLKAYSGCVTVSKGDPEAAIKVPEGQVLFIVSATLGGDCRARRYSNYPTTPAEGKSIPGCYLHPCGKDDDGDFQLFYITVRNQNVEPCCIAHIGLDQIHCSGGNAPMNVDFKQEIRTCISVGNHDEEKIYLRCSGAGTWFVHYWVGHPSTIPQLHMYSSGETSTEGAKVS